MRIFGTFLAALAIATAAQATAPAVPGGRFAAELAVFARENAQAPVRAGGTLFLGSSSVRLWTRIDRLPARDGINRGFGGATAREVLANYVTLVGPHAPANVIVYVGENDIANGRSPDQVAADVLALLARVRRDFPAARIAYLSMKPSPRRFALWPEMIAANLAIAAQANGQFDAIDVASGLMTAQSTPDAACFGADGLHMNAQGYARWNAIVAAYLAKPATPRPAVTLESTQPLS